MRKLFFFTLSLIMGLAIFGLATSKVGFEEIREVFSSFPISGLIVILILTALIALVGTWRLKFILKSQGYDLPFSKLTEVWLTGFAISYLTPIAIFGGEVFMIYALRRFFPLSWEKSSAAIFIHRVLDATIFFPFLVLGVFTFFFLAGSFPAAKIIAAGGVVAAFLIFLLIVFYIKSFRRESPLEWFLKLFGMNRKKLEKKEGGRLILGAEKEIVSFFGLKRKEMWQGLGISLVKYLLVLARCWLLIFFFKGGWDIFNALSAYGFFNLATLVPVPAMLGSLEIAEGLVFSGLGLGANVGLAFSFLLRAMDVLICLIGIILLMKFGMKLVKVKVIELIDKVVFNKNSLFMG